MSANLRNQNVKSKRRIVSSEECKKDLQKELQLMFTAFGQAVVNYENEIILTPPESRARAFEASLLNSKMMQSIQQNFPHNWKFGKYRRFILNVGGYNVFFKKLNNKDMPMNIRTQYASAIENQQQMSLFDDSFGITEPIVFFGYKKNKLGEIIDSKLVYIDEGKVNWTITNDDVITTKEFVLQQNSNSSNLLSVRPEIQKRKKASS